MKIEIFSVAVALCGFLATVSGFANREQPNACIDKRPDCKSFRRSGWCETRASIMQKVCKKTCKICEDSNVSEQKVGTSKSPQQKSKQGSCDHTKDIMGKTRCQYYRYIGWCEKRKSMKFYCNKTCICEGGLNGKPVCTQSKYGCCWDKKTKKQSSSGAGCPACVDDSRFSSLCNRFKIDCQVSGNLGKSLRQYCPKSCNVC